MEAQIRVRDANELGLRAVDFVSKNPAAGRAVRVHELATKEAFATGADAGDQDPVARLERRHSWPHGVDDAHALVTQDAAGLTTRDVTFEDMQVGAADRRLRYFDDGVRGLGDCRPWPIFESYIPRP